MTTRRIAGECSLPHDGASGRRASRRRERPASDSRTSGVQSPEPRGADAFPDYVPDPLIVGRRDFLVARNISPEFAAKLLDRVPGAVLVPWDVPAGSVIFPRVPSRGFARRLQTHCKRGHDLTDESNIYRAPRSSVRLCRECIRWRRRQRKSA